MSQEDEKPPLDAALRHLAEQQRRSLTSHPTPQELAAYHAGELPPEEEARILDHLAICRECSDLLLELSGFADLKPPEGMPELTDAQVEEDWQALRAKMRKEAPERQPAPVVPIRPVAKPERRFWLPIAASLLAVLGFSFGLYQSVKLARYSEPQLVRQVDSGSGVRGEGESQSFSSQKPGVVRLSPNPNTETSYRSYETEIVSEKLGEVVKRFPVETIDEDPLLLIPAGSLAPGTYRAYLYGIKPGERDELSEVSFNVDGP